MSYRKEPPKEEVAMAAASSSSHDIDVASIGESSRGTQSHSRTHSAVEILTEHNDQSTSKDGSSDDGGDSIEVMPSLAYCSSPAADASQMTSKAASLKESDMDAIKVAFDVPPSDEKPLQAVVVQPKPAPAPKKRGFDGDTSYLDGLRGIAMIMVFNEHFSTHTWTGLYPNVLNAYSAQSIIASKVGLVLFFVLSGRLNVTSYFRRMGTGTPINWGSLPDAMFRRTIRLAGMSIIMMAIQKAECAGGAFDLAITAQRTVLHTESSTMWYPGWCNLTSDPKTYQVIHHWTSARQIFTSLLQIFTDFDGSTVLIENSMLWSLPVQLWGMMFVLMLMPFLAYMTASRRFIFYGLLSIGLGYTYSHYLPFLIGLICADLKATGQLRRFQNFSRLAYIFVECVCAGLFMFFLCYNQAIWALVKRWAPTTFKNGSIGFSTSEDDFARQPTELFRAFLIMLWLEMSPVLQWLIGNFLFKALGRVAFGFYLSQMSVQYLLIPHMAIYFDKKGNLWWSGIVAMWFACFLLNWALGWLMCKYIDDPLAKLAPWIIKNTRSQGVSGLGASAFKDVWSGVTALPGYFTKTLPNNASNKWKACKDRTWKLVHWRTPAPQVPVPTDPSVYGLTDSDLHSTLFTADISDDPQAVRTRKLLRAWSYASPINFIMVPFIAFVWTWWNPWLKWVVGDPITFSLLWRILWLGSLPLCVMTWIGYCVPDITRLPEQQETRKVHRDKIRNLYILSVTRGSNEEATRRSYAQLKKLEKYHPAVKVMVLTDEPYAYPDLDNVVTPKAHKSPLGLAKHKARALDYFRQHMGLTGYDHVLHMDEESTMDAESLRGCLDFLRYTPHHIGQGIITYNAYNYMEKPKSWVYGVADALRVGDDLGRFNLQCNTINRPVFGIHGSFLMLSGDAENNVGWDYSSLVEDFEFSQAAWKKGYTLGRIHGIVREQSPENMRDFLKQRRRWFMGIRQISGKYPLPTIAIKLWTSGVFCLAATLLNLLFSPLISQSSTTPWWMQVVSAFCFAGFEWLYVSGMLFSEFDYGYAVKDWWKVPVHVVATVILQPVAAVLEACAVVWALSSADDEVGFEVVKK